MKILIRSLRDYAPLWRISLPLLLLVIATPPLVLSLPLVERYLIDTVLLSRHLNALSWAIALYGILWLAGMAGQLLASPLQSYLGEKMALLLRQRLYSHYITLSLEFARREHSGRMIALFLNDVPIAAGIFAATVVAGLGSVVTLLVGLALMAGLNWQLALAALVVPPGVGAVAHRLTTSLRPAAAQAQEKAAEMVEHLQESLTGLRELAAFGQEGSQSKRFGTTSSELLRLRMRLVRLGTAMSAGQSVFSLAVSLVILGYGGLLVSRGETTVGTLVAMRSLFAAAYQPARQLLGTLRGVQTALASSDRVYTFLDRTPRVCERPDAVALAAFHGEVTYEGVSFAYSPERPIVRDVSFAARPGELIAIVGPSGAGKTTLIDLLLRFYDPDTGSISLDGHDLRSLTFGSVREQIGVVFQDTFLFAGTIRDNIALGRPGATELEIVAAARAAHAWEFIEQTPRQLATPVGERGVQLSEGQKQRLAIARALLRDPRLLILDEPTAALDARSERLLQAALDNLMRGRTTLIIAHRLATVRRADRILVLDGGRIVEQGTHEELLRQGGLYRELHDLQSDLDTHAEQQPAALVSA